MEIDMTHQGHYQQSSKTAAKWEEMFAVPTKFIKINDIKSKIIKRKMMRIYTQKSLINTY